MYTIIVGGGRIGSCLASKLFKRENEILIIEKDIERFKHLQSSFGDDLVYFGDGCELRVQRDAGFNRADVIVAATGSDSDNLIIAQLGKNKWDVNRAIARINDPKNEVLFKKLGINEYIHASEIVASLLEQKIETDEMLTLSNLVHERYELVETILSSRSPIVGLLCRDVELPESSFFLFYIRDNIAHAVSEDTVFETGDAVALLTTRDNIPKVDAILCD